MINLIRFTKCFCLVLFRSDSFRTSSSRNAVAFGNSIGDTFCPFRDGRCFESGLSEQCAIGASVFKVRISGEIRRFEVVLGHDVLCYFAKMRRAQVDSKLLTPRFWPRVRREDWLKQAEKELKGGKTAQLSYQSRDGIQRHPLYLAEDLDLAWLSQMMTAMDVAYDNRAVDTNSNSVDWISRPDCSHRDAVKMMSFVEQELQRGENSIWLKFVDRQRAGDVNPAASKGGSELGFGCSWEGWMGLHHALSLAAENDADAIHHHDRSLEIVAETGVLGAMPDYEKHRGSWRHRVKVTTLFDPLAAQASWGQLAQPLEQLWDRWIEVEGSNASPQHDDRLGISMVDYHEAGATHVDQLAYALATGVEYLRQIESRGKNIDRFVHKMIFQFAIGRDFFGEIAKLRAFRVLWSRVEAACGLLGASTIRVHARSSLREQACDDPWNNVLRGTLSSLAAVLGGVDSLTTLSFDILSGGSDLGRRLAANTQTVLGRESGLGRVKDPLRGSYFLESLGHQLAQAAWQRFQSIEAAGGMVSFLKSGQLHQNLGLATKQLQDDIASGTRVVLGVNRYADLQGERLTIQHAAYQRPHQAIPIVDSTRDWRVLRGQFDKLCQGLQQRPRSWSIGVGKHRDLPKHLEFARHALQCAGFQSGGTFFFEDVADAVQHIESKLPEKLTGVLILALEDEDDARFEALIEKISKLGQVVLTLSGAAKDVLSSNARRHERVDGVFYRGVLLPSLLSELVRRLSDRREQQPEIVSGETR